MVSSDHSYPQYHHHQPYQYHNDTFHHDIAHICQNSSQNNSSQWIATPPQHQPLSSMLLLHDPNVDRELKHIARRMLLKQRKAGIPDDHDNDSDNDNDDSSRSGRNDGNSATTVTTATAAAAPSLFVILPTLKSYNRYRERWLQSTYAHAHPYAQVHTHDTHDVHAFETMNNRASMSATQGLSELEFRLYFMCDYGGGQDEWPLRLHLCTEEHSPMGPANDSIDSEMRDDSEEPYYHRCYQYPHHHPMDDIGVGGFRLADLDQFLSVYTIPMLSLLRALQDSHDPTVPNGITNSSMYFGNSSEDAMMNAPIDPSHIAGRIRAAIRFLTTTTRAREALLDFQEHPTVDEKDFEEYESAFPNLQAADFWAHMIPSGDSSANNSTALCTDSKILGGRVLCQMSNFAMSEGILWLCPSHNAVFCNIFAAQRLKEFIQQHHGDCVPIEKSCEIQFFKREDARMFYAMLVEYKCLIKLKIRLAWPRDDNANECKRGLSDADDEDDDERHFKSGELCEAVHASTLRELTIDCGGYCTIFDRDPDELTQSDQDDGKVFPSIVGYICHRGLMSFTVEKFDGYLFPDQISLEAQGPVESFSLTEFRRHASKSLLQLAEEQKNTAGNIIATTTTNNNNNNNNFVLSLHNSITLRHLAIRHWTRYFNAQTFASVVACCRELRELETQISDLHQMMYSLQDKIPNFGKLTYLNLSVSTLESAEGVIWQVHDDQDKDQPRRAAIRKVQHMGTFEAMHNVILNNIVSLQTMDLACETVYFAEWWSFLTQELLEAEAIAAAAALALDDDDDDDGSDSGALTGLTFDKLRRKDHRQPVLLRLNDLRGHCLESSCTRRMDQTQLMITSYDDSFRPYLQSLSRVAKALNIDAEFVQAQSLELLAQHAAVDGLWFHELVWFMTPQTRGNSVFMRALQSLVRRPEVQKFTIRISADGGGGAEGGSENKSDIFSSSSSSSSSLEQIRTLVQTWNEVTGMRLGWVEYGQWMQELVVQLEHPFRETVCLPTGAGEISFASEDRVRIGAPSPPVPNEVENPHGGPIVFSLSCRCI
ncbi:hypothetical protein BCR41DRAFT_366204 [Lobosporangium transversale]|uniref:Uncharacterized protein n=2 Tax=Lobosporangium transversale TaxID=64571 RepID=A0A1Y2FY05_9FUNG|nr:hypothetical protein BCR41DRAFT_366204 [Lobosporangium transversale]ORY88915.1 hypothetical protein BCR41DRAFT_366204 [Lobosporangium transversale]|eukprot:XP_021875023.1 hypothetical protein BCR41DRAFT_366204 [Lobosporangium transversale]